MLRLRVERQEALLFHLSNAIIYKMPQFPELICVLRVLGTMVENATTGMPSWTVTLMTIKPFLDFLLLHGSVFITQRRKYKMKREY